MSAKKCEPKRFEPKGARRSAAGTKWLNFERIQNDKHGALVVGLMIAADDILLANWSALRYSEENEMKLPRMQRHLRIGALQYFVRLMAAHLHEALPLVDQFRQEAELERILKKCSREARCGYAAMCDCLRGGPDAGIFGSQVSRLRNKLSFHYDREHLVRAIERLALDPTHPPAPITMGADYYLSRFNLADRVIDSALVREVVQNLPGDTDREKLNSFQDFINQKCLAFLFFANEFSAVYFSV
jgi:hypothetical protein